MTAALSARDAAGSIEERFPGSIGETADNSIVVNHDRLVEVMEFLRDDDGYRLEYLNFITGVDYYDYFEVVYQLTSLEHNHNLVIKARCGRDNPSVPSVAGVWKGAEVQEREVYDLMGIRFEGHPNLKRLFLWDGFAGHPLRKDFL